MLPATSGQLLTLFFMIVSEPDVELLAVFAISKSS